MSTEGEKIAYIKFVQLFNYKKPAGKLIKFNWWFYTKYYANKIYQWLIKDL